MQQAQPRRIGENLKSPPHRVRLLQVDEQPIFNGRFGRALWCAGLTWRYSLHISLIHYIVYYLSTRAYSSCLYQLEITGNLRTTPLRENDLVLVSLTQCDIYGAVSNAVGYPASLLVSRKVNPAFAMHPHSGTRSFAELKRDACALRRLSAVICMHRRLAPLGRAVQ